MKKWFAFLLIVSISGIAIKTEAAVGCLSNNTTYTYINRESSWDMYWHGHNVETYYHRYESDRRATANSFCVTPVVPSQPCYIHATRSGYSDSPGILVNYYTSSNQCNVPLDDYAGLLILAASAVGFFVVRKNLMS